MANHTYLEIPSNTTNEEITLQKDIPVMAQLPNLGMVLVAMHYMLYEKQSSFFKTILYIFYSMTFKVKLNRVPKFDDIVKFASTKVSNNAETSHSASSVKSFSHGMP